LIREEARAIAWFLTGLRREAIRLTKKYRQLDEHELLILNGPVPQSIDGDKLTMIDVIPAAVDEMFPVKLKVWYLSRKPSCY